MNEWKKYRKKPVTIRAYKWNGDADNIVRPYPNERFSTGFEECSRCGRKASLHGLCDIEKGNHIVCLGDWIIEGANGDYHPCKPEAFEKTYEEVH